MLIDFFFSITIEKTVATIFDVGLPGDIHISMYILMYIYEYTTFRFARRLHEPYVNKCTYVCTYMYITARFARRPHKPM